MLPKTVRIGCYDYAVIETDEVLIVDGSECKGQIDYNRHEIKISNKDTFGDQSKEQTLWHEIVHGIISYRRVDPQKADHETLVDELALALYGMCKSNGKLPGQK